MFKIISRTVLGFAQIVNIIRPLICKIFVFNTNCFDFLIRGRCHLYDKIKVKLYPLFLQPPHCNYIY